MALAVLPRFLTFRNMGQVSMVDWHLVARIAGGGFGVTLFVLVILSLLAWVMGLIIQKTAKTATEGEEIPAKDK